MKFHHYRNPDGSRGVLSLGKFPDSTSAREKLKTLASEALGEAPAGWRFTGSILCSENPGGQVGIVAWSRAVRDVDPQGD